MAPRAGWQDKIKAYLAKHPGSTARQMADALDYDRKKITDVLSKLAKKGMVERTEDGPPHPTRGTPQFVFYLMGGVPQATLEEPTLEEPTLEEPTLEEPALEEPTLEEPTLEEPALEEPPQIEEEIDQRVVVTAPEPPKEGETWVDKIIDFVRENPGATNAEIGDGTGYGRGNVSGTTTTLWRQGVFERTAGPHPKGPGKMQPRNYLKGKAPAGEPLLEKTPPKPRKTTVDKYNEAVKAAQERAAQEAAEDEEDIEEDEPPKALMDESQSEDSWTPVQDPRDAPTLTGQNHAHSVTRGFDAAIDKLASIIAERIIERALETIEASLNQHLSPSRASKSIEGLGELHSKPAERNGKPSALVVGLLPQQQALLQSDYHRAVKLTFFKDGNLKLLQQKAQSVEHILVACDFVSHATTDALRGHKDKLQLLRGGMSTVRDALGAIVTGA